MLHNFTFFLLMIVFVQTYGIVSCGSTSINYKLNDGKIDLPLLTFLKLGWRHTKLF